MRRTVAEALIEPLMMEMKVKYTKLHTCHFASIEMIIHVCEANP